MLIRAKLFRPGGTRVELGKGKDMRRYHFRPEDRNAKQDDPEVDHVAEVDNADDIGTLLAIKEGYEVHASEIKKPAAVKATKAAEKKQAEEDARGPANTFAVTGASWSGGIALLNANSTFGLSVGEEVSVEDVHPSGYNLRNARLIEVTPGSVKYTLPSNPGPWSLGGTITRVMQRGQVPVPQKPYASMNKPELVKLVAERTGKQPHGSTARAKLVETLEKLDKKPA